MASFDFQSGVSGAGAGAAVGGPYGAIAGFVIGGFLGGHQKKKAEKKAQKREKQLKKLASPEHLAEVTKQLTPQFRQQVAGGAGAALTGAIQNSVARRGLTGTGVGTALTAGASAVPETMAFQQALGSAEGVVNRQISAKKGTAPYEGEDIAGLFNQAGDAAMMFKQLSAGSAGNPNGLQLVSQGEGEAPPWEPQGPAAEEFANTYTDDLFATYGRR